MENYTSATENVSLKKRNMPKRFLFLSPEARYVD